MGGERVEVAVAAIRSVMGEDQLTDLTAVGEVRRGFDGGVAVTPGSSLFRVPEVAVVQQDVSSIGQRFGGSSQLRGHAFVQRVIRQISHARRIHLHPDPHGGPAFVSHRCHQDPGTRGRLELTRQQGTEGPIAEQPFGTDREIRRCERPCEEVAGIGMGAIHRHVQRDPGVGTVDRPAKRQPLHMIPMKMGQHDVALERDDRQAGQAVNAARCRRQGSDAERPRSRRRVRRSWCGRHNE